MLAALSLLARAGTDLRKLTISEADSFKIVVFSDLLIDNDGSNFAYTLQNMQNILAAET
jgi:hypothetical protein